MRADGIAGSENLIRLPTATSESLHPLVRRKKDTRMSYILDALKKSEGQRTQGEIPNIHSPHSLSPQPSRKPSIRLYVMIVLLLLNAGVLAWLFSPWSGKPMTYPPQQSQQDAKHLQNTEPETTPLKATSRHLAGEESQTGERAVGSRQAEATRISAEKSPRIASGADPQASSGENQSGVGTKESGRKASISVPSPLETKKPAPPSDLPVRQSGARKNSAEDAANQLIAELRKVAGATGGLQTVSNPAELSRSDQINQEQTTLSPRADIIARLPFDTIGRQQMQSAVEDQTPLTDATGRDRSPTDAPQLENGGDTKKPHIPDFLELPLKLQRQVPSMSFSMLVYSEKPTERMISINGRTVREGEEVSAGLKLERIMPDCAVFRFKGKRFLRGIF